VTGVAFEPVDEVAADPATARVYEEGWQSWSPVGLHPTPGTSARPGLPWQHTMRFRPGARLPETGFQGEGLLVVDPGDGADVRLYSAPDPTDEVPSVRARWVDGRVLVEADGRVDVHRSAGTVGAALAAHGDALAGALLASPLRPAPTVWCSWYQYFLEVTEADVVENLVALDRLALPVDVVQVDDGWQAGIGDWLALSGRFTSLERLVGRIRDTGRRAGVWVAPFVVGAGSRLAGDHPAWLRGDAGVNWDQPLHGLDLSRTDVLEHLAAVFERLREAGFDYYKLDFLYAGALPGPRQGDLSAVAAYRQGLRVIREAVGDSAELLGCGAPLLPSVGLVDAMRVSPDTFNPIDPADLASGAPALRGRSGVEARAWQQGRLWVNDADCAVLRPSFGRREEWAGVVEAWSGLRSFSDRVAELDGWGVETARRLLATVPAPEPFRTLPPDYLR
jgi:alpha-galactosidase